jgi:hypothetical protein
VLGCAECLSVHSKATCSKCCHSNNNNNNNNTDVSRKDMYSMEMLNKLLAEVKGTCRACGQRNISNSHWRHHATASCKKRPMPCPEKERGCEFYGTPEQLALHKEKTCLLAEFPCTNNCGVACLLRSEMAEHVSKWCVRRKTKCVMDGCDSQLLEADVANHQRVCPWRQVACVGYTLGCIAQHAYKQRATHEDVCPLAGHVMELAKCRAENIKLRGIVARLDPSNSVYAAAAALPNKRCKKNHSALPQIAAAAAAVAL